MFFLSDLPGDAYKAITIGRIDLQSLEFNSNIIINSNVINIFYSVVFVYVYSVKDIMTSYSNIRLEFIQKWYKEILEYYNVTVEANRKVEFKEELDKFMESLNLVDEEKLLLEV